MKLRFVNLRNPMMRDYCVELDGVAIGDVCAVERETWCAFPKDDLHKWEAFPTRREAAEWLKARKEGE